MEHLKYPIGRFIMPDPIDKDMRQHFIHVLQQLPDLLQNAVKDLSMGQLTTPYREGGWTLLQVVHHLADSHMNGYIRFKLALTEDQPTIKPFNEKKWAELPDSLQMNPAISISLLEAVHSRWVYLLRSLDEKDFSRGFTHPENGKMDLNQVLALYAWHSKHHLAHITSLLDRMDWKK
ncbi:YfiT family bacillithiol transferase [Bacillus smithii]|uniref:YfiT family bacillithiol transferase n=1 Tax=Bacillus smithii TaxID=1479 RepID=UPI0030C8FB88